MTQKRSVLLGLVLVFLIPALAAAAAAKKHPEVSADQECAECHADEGKAWLAGKHGLMNVKCFVCHGDLVQRFTIQPGIAQCRACHGEQVAQVEKTLPGKRKTCFLCHDPHTVAARFHRKGGK